MNLYNLDPIYLKKRAKELGFIRDTFEKVLRLSSILQFLNTHPLLKEKLSLKGGTALNLIVFDLPRLSVDIDLDYTKPESKEEMMLNREKVDTVIQQQLESMGYVKSPKSKTPYSLDSTVYEYMNSGGNRDNIKIEINYSLRSHIFESEKRNLLSNLFPDKFEVTILSPIEIYAGKINALLNRSAARDLYDIWKMIDYDLFNTAEKRLLRKSVLFYKVISSKSITSTFDTKGIENITQRKIRRELIPVIRTDDNFELDRAKRVVIEYINELMQLSDSESEFLRQFKLKVYHPELLFDDENIVQRLLTHPMALWKTRKQDK